MGYNKKHTKVLDSQTWYNILHNQYKTYRKHLDSFENGYFTRFIPRKDKLHILYIGAGDWRLFRFLKGHNYERYVAFDIADKLLENHPWKVEKIVGDAEKELPFEDNSFDVIMAFFVLEHIDNLKNIFYEVYRILKPGWTRVIGHFLQRREYTHVYKGDYFKVEQYKYTIDDIKDLANDAFFTTHIHNVYEWKVHLWYIISLEK